MNPIFYLTKRISIHLVGFVLASILASLISNIIVEAISFSSENAEYTVKGMIDLILVVAVYLLINAHLKESLKNLYQFGKKTDYMAVLLAVAATLLVIMILYGLGLYQIAEKQQSNEVLIILLALFAQSMTQEVLFRGIFFRQIAKVYPALYVAFCLSLTLALLNILVDGLFVQPFISALLINFVLCMLYQQRQSLLLPALVNTSQLYITFLTGILDEHWRNSALFITKTSDSVLFSGGHFGPESSFFGLLALSAATIFLYRKHKSIKQY